MRYTREERLQIGKRIYDGEISRFRAADEYGIGEATARDYMRLYRDVNHLPSKAPGVRMGTVTKEKNGSERTSPDYESMTREELIAEIKRLRKQLRTRIRRYGA